MLEIKYLKDSGIIIASASSPDHKGGHYKPKKGEGIALFDTIPDKPINAYLYNGTSLIDNPDYIEPTHRDYGKEIDAINQRLDHTLPA